MAGKKEVPERRSGLRPSEKELPERSSGAFRHKNTPGYDHNSFPALCIVCRSDRVSSVAWNSTDASKLECIQRKFVAVCHNRFFPQIHYSYVNALEHLNFNTLSSRRCHLDALFLVNFYTGFKFCPSLLETVGIHVPVRNFRDFPLFAVGSSHKSCCSAKSASAANTICKDTDIFSKQLVTVNYILK
jgi:hypothetical protein